MKGSIELGNWRLAWDKIVEREIERGSEIYEHVSKRVASDIRNSLAGGDCVRCGKPWAKVEVRNRYAEFDYYVPGCGCYPTCRKVVQYHAHDGQFDMGCGRKMYEELDAGPKYRDGHAYVRCNNCNNEICVDKYLNAQETARMARNA